MNFYGTAWEAFSYCLGSIACFSKHGVLLFYFFCDFTFSFTGEKIHTIYILAFSAQRGQNQKNEDGDINKHIRKYLFKNFMIKVLGGG